MMMLFNTLCSKWYITKWILLRQMYKIQMYAITTWNFLVGIICKWNHSVVNFLRPICVSVEAITYRTQCAVFYFGIKSSTNIFIFRLFLYGYKENSDRKIKTVYCTFLNQFRTLYKYNELFRKAELRKLKRGFNYNENDFRKLPPSKVCTFSKGKMLPFYQTSLPEKNAFKPLFKS